MRPAISILLGLLAATTVHAATDHLPYLPASIGGLPIAVQLADTPQARTIGLMHRHQLPPDAGMLFVYPAVETELCFWMRHTPLPLTLAFIGEDRRIIHIQAMQPWSETLHCSPAPARYVLEMPSSWPGWQKLRPGSLLQPPSATDPG